MDFGIYFGPDRTNPIYYRYKNTFYDSRGTPYVRPVYFLEGEPPSLVPSVPSLEGYGFLRIASPLKYAPVVASVPGTTALYSDNSQKTIPSNPTGYGNYTNWYFIGLIPSPFGDQLEFRTGEILPGLNVGSLSPWADILLKVFSGVPIFYNAGDDSDPLLLTLNGQNLSRDLLEKNFHGFRYLYIDDFNQKLAVFSNKVDVLTIQRNGELIPSRIDPRKSPFNRFSGVSTIGSAIDVDIEKYSQLNSQVLQPLYLKGFQTGVRYDTYQKALDLLKSIQQKQKQLTEIEAEYRQIQTELQAQIQEYNTIKNSL